MKACYGLTLQSSATQSKRLHLSTLTLTTCQTKPSTCLKSRSVRAIKIIRIISWASKSKVRPTREARLRISATAWMECMRWVCQDRGKKLVKHPQGSTLRSRLRSTLWTASILARVAGHLFLKISLVSLWHKTRSCSSLINKAQSSEFKWIPMSSRLGPQFKNQPLIWFFKPREEQKGTGLE